MANEENLKPFKKGYDPRRNLRGVPKTALEVKKRFEKIGAELLLLKEKVPIPGTDEYETVQYEITRMDAMLRRMYSSNSPADRKEILERVAGKVPQAVTVGGPNGEALIPTPDKEADARHDRALSSLADAIRASIPGASAEPDGAVDTAK